MASITDNVFFRRVASRILAVPIVASLWQRPVVRFLVVGVVNTAFGYSIYAAAILCGSPYQLALAISTVLGVAFNFFTIGGVVFNNRDVHRIARFVTGYAAMFLLNLGLLSLLVGRGVDKLLSQALALPVVVIVTFLVNKFLVFGAKR